MTKKSELEGLINLGRSHTWDSFWKKMPPRPDEARTCRLDTCGICDGHLSALIDAKEPQLGLYCYACKAMRASFILAREEP